MSGARLFVHLTSAADSTSHLVDLRLYEAGLVEGAGRFTAVCGRIVPAASLAAAPGPVCPLCRAAVTG